MGDAARHITDAEFESTILQAATPALVDFWAAWCGPCRMIAPIVEELAGEYGGQAMIAKLDVDSNRETATKYGIQSIPTLLFFKDGEMVDKLVGTADKKTIKAKLDALI